jgi:hypothetical protein
MNTIAETTGSEIAETTGLENKMIAFDKPKLARFKEAYSQASRKAQSSFQFEGDTFVSNYAKYLIEYIEGSL